MKAKSVKLALENSRKTLARALEYPMNRPQLLLFAVAEAQQEALEAIYDQLEPHFVGAQYNDPLDAPSS